MTVRGHVENGAIVLDEDVALPEGAKVTVALDEDRELERLRESLHPELRPWVGILRHVGDRDLEEEYRQHLYDKYMG